MDDAAPALEALAFAAWPAEEVVDLGGWWLRHTRGFTRRANSVWPRAALGGAPLDARIDAAERFYAERGQPALFQVSPAAQPPGLDEALARRGYALEAPVALQVAPADAAAARVDHAVRITDTPGLPWLEVSARRASPGRGQVDERHLGLLRRLAPRALFALAERQGEPAAVGMVAVDGPWAGVFSMLTLPAHRRRGLGRAVLAALAAAARARGAQRLYLQVERDNAGARALYAACGFLEVGGYHYRRGGAGPLT